MQTLDKRHEDRIRRKADNRTDPAAVAPGVSVGSAVDAFRNAFTLMGRLSPEDRARAQEAVGGLNPEDFVGVSLAEADDGNTMAGIGVVNPFVVPNAAYEQAPTLPASELDPNDGQNLNGKALADQAGEAGAWGTAGNASSADLKGNGGGDGSEADKGAETAPAKAPKGSGSGK